MSKTIDRINNALVTAHILQLQARALKRRIEVFNIEFHSLKIKLSCPKQTKIIKLRPRLRKLL